MSVERKQILAPFKSANHAHARCLKSALTKAESVCQARGVRLTRLRRRVLELVLGSHEPVKAYEVLEQLGTQRKRAAPPTVYRALDFLQEEGFVHRIESMNAYIGCGEPGHQGASQFLICHKCGEVAELDDDEIFAVIFKKAKRLGFRIDDQTVELKGLCKSCRPG